MEAEVKKKSDAYQVGRDCVDPHRLVHTHPIPIPRARLYYCETEWKGDSGGSVEQEVGDCVEDGSASVLEGGKKGVDE